MAGAEKAPSRGHHASSAAVATQRQVSRSGGIVPSESGTRSQSRLHSFSLPSLGWGTQRLLRCAKVDPQAKFPSDGGQSAEEESSGKQVVLALAPPRLREGAGGGGEREGKGKDEHLHKSRNEMMTEFRKTIEKIPLPSTSGSHLEESKRISESSSSPAVEEASRPWNLRLRRAAACSAASAAEESKVQKATNQEVLGDGLLELAVANTGRVRRFEAIPGKEKRPRFSTVLSKEEIAEDFFLMTGTRPPRRPKKRPRLVQRQIETLCPAFYLTEITPDMYKTSTQQGH